MYTRQWWLYTDWYWISRNCEGFLSIHRGNSTHVRADMHSCIHNAPPTVVLHFCTHFSSSIHNIKRHVYLYNSLIGTESAEIVRIFYLWVEVNATQWAHVHVEMHSCTHNAPAALVLSLINLRHKKACLFVQTNINERLPFWGSSHDWPDKTVGIKLMYSHLNWFVEEFGTAILPPIIHAMSDFLTGIAENGTAS